MTMNVLGQTLTEDDLAAVSGEAMTATGGHPPGHGQRSAGIGVIVGEAVGVDQETLATVKLAAQVEAAGCPKNDALTQWLWGTDPAAVKREVTIFERTCLKSSMQLARHVLVGASWPQRLRRILDLTFHRSEYTRFAYRVRCTYGTAILRQMGFSDAVIEAVDYGNERWDGSGAPYGLRGDQIPIASQLYSFGRFADAVAFQHGVSAISELLNRTHRRWFCRELQRAFRSVNTSELWQLINDSVRLRAKLASVGSGRSMPVTTERMNNACDALADMQGVRDPFTGGHQQRVADIAVLLAVTLGLPLDEVELVRWSALLHDLGKLKVALAILLKKGQLTPDERAKMEIHPGMSRSYLSLAAAFREMAAYAGAHHEKFEGGGYPTGLPYPFGLDRLGYCRNPLIAAIVTMADVIDALISERPYRASMPLEQAYDIIVNKMPGHFHPECLAAMQAIWGTETFLAIVGRCVKANEDLILRMPEQELQNFREQQRKARAR